MTAAQYFRIETAAGGAFCTNRAFIRAAWRMLSRAGKGRGMRHARRVWICEGLDRLESSRRAALAMGARP